MKKIVFYVFIVMAAMLTISCTKKETANEQNHFNNRLIPIKSESGAKAQSYLMTYQVGHRAEGCKGCVTIAGISFHVNCMNFGHYCTSSATVQLQQVGSVITATTTNSFDLTSEDFYVMPDRSLSYTDENNNRVFLNIPAQMIFRDSVTRQFTFTGLFITNTPEYSND